MSSELPPPSSSSSTLLPAVAGNNGAPSSPDSHRPQSAPRSVHTPLDGSRPTILPALPTPGPLPHTQPATRQPAKKPITNKHASLPPAPLSPMLSSGSAGGLIPSSITSSDIVSGTGPKPHYSTEAPYGMIPSPFVRYPYGTMPLSGWDAPPLSETFDEMRSMGSIRLSKPKLSIPRAKKLGLWTSGAASPSACDYAKAYEAKPKYATTHICKSTLRTIQYPMTDSPGPASGFPRTVVQPRTCICTAKMDPPHRRRLDASRNHRHQWLQELMKGKTPDDVPELDYDTLEQNGVQLPPAYQPRTPEPYAYHDTRIGISFSKARRPETFVAKTLHFVPAVGDYTPKLTSTSRNVGKWQGVPVKSCPPKRTLAFFGSERPLYRLNDY